MFSIVPQRNIPVNKDESASYAFTRPSAHVPRPSCKYSFVSSVDNDQSWQVPEWVINNGRNRRRDCFDYKTSDQ